MSSGFARIILTYSMESSQLLTVLTAGILVSMSRQAHTVPCCKFAPCFSETLMFKIKLEGKSCHFFKGKKVW